jgi:uncharacterized lipoprotein YddW (UPF0748 family)
MSSHYRLCADGSKHYFQRLLRQTYISVTFFKILLRRISAILVVMLLSAASSISAQQPSQPPAIPFERIATPITHTSATAESRLSPALPLPENPRHELRAVKITNVDSQVMFSDEAIAQAMDYMASIGINAILPVVQNAGYTQYYSEVMNEYFGIPLDPRLNGRDPLKVIIREARRNGIEVYPWFEYGFAATYSGPQGPGHGGFIGRAYPGWLSRHANGDVCKKNGFDWLSGINPEVQEFMLKLIMEVVRNYDIDGIEFSDRMPALPRECGYDDATVARYRAEFNGNAPSPFNTNPDWMRWRADKLNDWYRAVRDSVKAYDENLFVASSPNLYPWGYQEYLQDPETWAIEGIVDHLIPQLYRYNINDYQFELSRSLNRLPVFARDIYFAGILMNVGSYLITPEYLRASIQANRQAGVAGEAYFFYEGLRKNQNELGALLREEFYTEGTLVPGRNGFQRRFPALDMALRLNTEGGWTVNEAVNTPFGALNVKPPPECEEDERFTPIMFNVPVDETGWYDLYVYTVADAGYAKQWHIESNTISIPQHRGPVTVNEGRDGWHHLGTFWMGGILVKKSDAVKSDEAGFATEQFFAFTIDHVQTATLNEQPVAFSAVMAVVNRKLGPLDTSVPYTDVSQPSLPSEPVLVRNFPNPFNPTTTLSVDIRESVNAHIQIYDIAGRFITQLHDGMLSAGRHQFTWNAGGQSSGLYFAVVRTENTSVLHTMTLIR